MSLKEKYPLIFEKSNAGQDIHLSELELKDFYAEAKRISPGTEWTPRGCIECVNHMVSLVFAKEETKTMKATGLEQKKEK
jgi:hypothetical protein